MTPKEKAGDLVRSYFKYIGVQIKENGKPDLIDYESRAKQCALIAVDEMLGLCWNGNEIALNYWQQVKTEIEKL